MSMVFILPDPVEDALNCFLQPFSHLVVGGFGLALPEKSSSATNLMLVSKEGLRTHLKSSLDWYSVWISRGHQCQTCPRCVYDLTFFMLYVDFSLTRRVMFAPATIRHFFTHKPFASESGSLAILPCLSYCL